jgi:hypothetical protein
MELTVAEYREKFSMCAVDRDLNALVRLRGALYKERMKMDAWFDKYLDMFDKQMDADKPETPVWKMYHKKSNEYSELNRLIASSEVYIKKVSNNV